MSEEMDQLHLTDDQFVDYCMDALAPDATVWVEMHLESCPVCREEASRVKQLSAFWNNDVNVARLERRIAAVIRPPQGNPSKEAQPWTLSAGLAAFLSPFAVSLKPLMRPQGAYGETMEDETTTLEFVVTQEGRIVEGLRGLLKRVNREYYVRIFALDPGSRTEFGDRKAMLSISDTYQDRPILHRRIDIGVTVLLGTDFRLTENSSLAVEMLPPFH